MDRFNPGNPVGPGRALSSAWTECVASDHVVGGSNPSGLVHLHLESDSPAGVGFAPNAYLLGTGFKSGERLSQPRTSAVCDSVWICTWVVQVVTGPPLGTFPLISPRSTGGRSFAEVCRIVFPYGKLPQPACFPEGCAVILGDERVRAIYKLQGETNWDRANRL